MAEYIERGALMQFPIRRDHYDRKNGNKHFINGIETVLEYAENLPAADVAPVVHGRWIEKSAPARKVYFECSHCGAQENKHTAIKGYYCWRCGAKMDGGDGDAVD